MPMIGSRRATGVLVVANDKISIAIVGAGETGTPLLRQLLAAPFVDVVGVADLDETAPGMALAGDNGIATTTGFLAMVRQHDDVDVVIDVTGVKQVRDGLRRHMQDTGNQRTIIMHEKVANLLMSLSRGELVRMKHDDTGY